MLARMFIDPVKAPADTPMASRDGDEIAPATAGGA
jgi:hypothetical protein